MQPALNLATAFTAGLLSFVSPCVLPLIPAYLSFLTGSSLEELRDESRDARGRILTHACAFSLGFSTIFVLAGLAAGTLGGALGPERALVARIGGALIVLFGLHMLGLFRIDALLADRRIRIGAMRRSPLASWIIGIGFAAGWSPCIGPILAGILVLASTEGRAAAAWLLTAYSLGLAVPLIATACGLGAALPLLNRIRPALRTIEAAAGAMLIAGGAVLFTGSFSQVAAAAARLFPGDRS